MPRTRPPYPPEFRAQMVELVRAGRSPGELAREFEPAEYTIRKWVQQADWDEGRREDGPTTDEKEEIRRLRREVRQLKLEREILAKAAARPTRRVGARHGRPTRSRPGLRVREGGAPLRSSGPAVDPVATMCRVLGVSTSGYYAWLKRPVSKRARQDVWLMERIETAHERSRKTYGSPRIHAEIRDQGIPVGRKRVARLMKAGGLAGVSRRKGTRTTIRDESSRRAPDLVHRDFTATGPNQLWVADITYVPTWSGFLFLAIVLDVWSRRVVGWAMETHLRTELVVQALNMAVSQCRPTQVIHHLEPGQYTSVAFGKRCERAGVLVSLGSVGDCYDNAMAEAWFATFETELLDRHSFQSPREARPVIFEYVEGWYNPHRWHSALGYQSPADFERNHSAEVGEAPGEFTLPGEADILAQETSSAPPVLLPRFAREALLTRWVGEGKVT